MKSRISLKSMLTLNFLLAAVIPLLISGLLMLYILTTNMTTEIEHKNFLLAQLLAGEIERFLAEPLGLLREIDQVVNVRKLIAADQIDAYLDAMITNYRFFQMLMIIDPTGRVRYLAPYDPDLLGNDMSGQEFFYRPHETGQPSWSPSFISFSTGHPTVTLSIPFNRGILVGYLNLAALEGIIAKVKVSSHGYACVTDRDGTVIADPEQTKVSQRLNIRDFEFVWQGLNSREGTFRGRFEGIDALSSVVIVPQTHWLVAVNQPIVDVYMPVRRIRNILLTGSSAAIILAIGIALVSLRITLRPLSQLTEQTRHVASGAYQSVPQDAHYQEVDELTVDFNRMVDAIKTREYALRESEEKLRTVFQAAVNVSFIITDTRDPEPLILEFSPGAEDIFGYARSEMIGHPVSILHLPDELAKFPAVHRAMREGRQGFRGETTLVRKSGEQFPALFSTYPLFDSQGQMYAVLGVSIDIAEQKRTEREVQQLNTELEQRVQERTAKLEAVNRELKDFAYVVSHDLKAPLRAISRLVQWLVADYAGAFDAKGQEMTNLLVGRVKRMDALIDGIFEYSRIGRLVGQHETINLNQLLPGIIDSLAPPPHTQVTLSSDLPVIVGDKIRIQQVFANLIGNAIKYMDKPQGTIMIRCENTDAEWRFSVADNGPGIDPKYHDKIFQIFQTLQPRDEFESTGVGLSIVKKIVGLYGGKIWIESEVGKGSTFYFTLPKT